MWSGGVGLFWMVLSFSLSMGVISWVDNSSLSTIAEAFFFLIWGVFSSSDERSRSSSESNPDFLVGGGALFLEMIFRLSLLLELSLFVVDDKFFCYFVWKKLYLFLLSICRLSLLLLELSVLVSFWSSSVRSESSRSTFSSSLESWEKWSTCEVLFL